MRQSVGDTLVGNVFTGDTDDKYQNHTIQCNDNQDCTILCEHTNSCKHTNIHCPATGKCHIECNSGLSENVCEGIRVTCPKNGDCRMKCTKNSACKDANIDGKTSTLFLSCSGDNTCANALINGKDTTHLRLGCGQYAENTCASLSVYFPHNVNEQKMATISAGDSLSGTDGHPLQFYAINGWNDVDITDYTGNWENHIGIMHCGCAYTMECSFKSNDWRCMNANDICNHPTISLLIEAPIPPTYNIKSTVIQTQIATVSSLYMHSPEVLLYVVIGTVGLCLCFLGLMCIYLQKHAMSSLHHTMMISISKLSSSSLNSSAKSIGIMRSNSQSKLKSLCPQPSESTVTNTTLSPSNPEVRSNVEEHSNTDNNPLCLETHYSTNTPTIIAVEKTDESLAPSKINISIHASLSSGDHDQPISYQQPHEFSQIMSILNESHPPSLSSFVRNNQNGAYIMNQQPIPPSAQSSTESVTATDTMTAQVNDKHNEIEYISSDESEAQGDQERAMVDILDRDMEYRIQTAKNYLAKNT